MSELNQRHQLVLLFTDLTDSTRIAARLEPEHYAELLSQLRQHTNTIIARHGGEVVRVDGDGALCIFGYPLAHEDAGRRATEAALDLHAAVAGISLDAAVSLHSGIHAGVVLLRSGDLVRGRYEMLGDATNVAARLCDAAGPGGILVSAETLGADRHFFQTGPERAIALSGHDQPLTALPVVGRDGLPNRFATREVRGLSPFVGRAVERSAVLDWLDSAAEQHAAILVHGPAGIGKSRFLRVLNADFAERGWAVARGYCEGYLGAPTLQPLLQIAAILDPEFAADHDRANRIEALIRERVTRPLVLAIDDWQWADDASSGLINRLIRDCPPMLRLLLFSREPDPRMDPGECREFALGPLEPSAARSTIERLLIAKDPFVIGQIESATGGSPLLIEELCHAFAANGRAARDTNFRGAWFDLSVQARFALLEPDDAQLLRLAAVIGNVIPPWLLAAVCGQAIDAQMLSRLQNADFLYPGDNGDNLRFKHGLTRDAVYAGIGLTERKTLHARIADQYLDLARNEGEAVAVDALAYHLAAADRLAEALPFAIQAGDAALTAGALDRAQAQHLAAFECFKALGPDHPESAELAALINRFGRACVIDPARDQVPVLEEMVAIARKDGTSRSLVLGLYWLGSIRFGLGDAKIAIVQLSEALDLAEGDSPGSMVAQLRASLGASLFDLGATEQARLNLISAIAEMRQELSASRIPAALYAISNLAQIHADRGEFVAADQLLAEIDSLIGDSEPLILSSLMTQRATISIWRGHYDEAMRFGEAAEHYGMRDRSRQNAMFGRALRAYSSFAANGDPAAADLLLEVLRWLDTSPYRHRTSLFFGWGADAMARLGKSSEARWCAARAFHRARHGDSFGEATAARAIALLAPFRATGPGPTFYQELAARSDERRQSRWFALNSSR